MFRLMYYFAGALMPYRLINIWLIISILGYSLVLAADIHGELLLQDNPGYVEKISHDKAADTDCGHCSHGTLHILGLENAFVFYLAQLNSPLRDDHQISFIPPIPQVIHRPPISA
ncbi:hypothetical protein [Thiolapillus brandeum]|nr:hypothetical protein [Thiolapillus brandeum]